MIGKNELNDFKKMWTWLAGYPAHDREYYMQHVVKLETTWPNNCPISNSVIVSECNGCNVLWNSSQGTLCTDENSPLAKWMDTEREQPHERSFYASQLAVRAMRLLKDLESRVKRCRDRCNCKKAA